MMKSIEDKLHDLDAKLEAYAQGLQNVYNEFKKYELNKIDTRISDLLTKIKNYELQKDVKEFNIDVWSYPMNVRTKLRIKTNFGEVIYKFDFPPALEYQLSHVIQANYINMLNRLYDEHDKRGGKYMGDEGCKAWVDENGDTFVNLGESLMSR